MKLGILASHPVQYHAPVFRELARHSELQVFYAHRPDAAEQGRVGFGVPFKWDTDLLSGYSHEFLCNRSAVPDVTRFNGCDTPDVGAAIHAGRFDAFLLTGWNLRCYWQAWRGCKAGGVPVLVRGDSQLTTPRSQFKQALKAVIYPTLLRAFDGFCFVGQRNREYLRHYGAVEKKLFFSPHCVDTARFSNCGEAITITKQRLGLPTDGAVVLYVGKLIPDKRVADLIGAMAVLRRKHVSVHLAVVGAGAGEPALRRQAADLQVPVNFLGFRNQTELPAIYSASDVLVLASNGAETWGLVVNEASAAGTPAVVSDAVGCGPDLIDDDLTGEIFPCGDIEALAAAVHRVLSRGKNEPVRAALAHKCEIYSVPNAARGILEAMTSVTGLNHG